MPRDLRQERSEPARAVAPARGLHRALPAREALLRPAGGCAPAGAARAPLAARRARHLSLRADVRLACELAHPARSLLAQHLHPQAEGAAADARLPPALLARGLRHLRLRAP